MSNFIKGILWRHFAASIDMFKNAIDLCPEEYWNGYRKFFYSAYHTLVFLDYYPSIPPKYFSSPLSYTFTAPANIPARKYYACKYTKLYRQEIKKATERKAAVAE